MKKCRTLNGLLNAIKKGVECRLYYTELRPTRDGYIIYAVDGTNIIITEETYDEIKYHLVKQS